jgi:aryl-alcohol dehydrogenase-like predicted oxidoreductase
MPPATRAIGPFEVSAIGLGCMSLSHAYGPPPPRDQARAVLERSLDLGCTFFDTAAIYGVGHNEELVGEVLGPHRDKFILASKCGLSVSADGKGREINGKPEALKATCEQSLKRLKTEVIDLYYIHRWDRRVPIEESVGALAELKREGKIRSIGLSEVSAPTLRRAHAVHPIAALQTEYSPWTRNPEVAVLDACAELGTAFVAFSPVARGFLADGVRDVEALAAHDLRRTMPRFMGDNFAANLKLLDRFIALAKANDCTPAQLCLAWLLAKAPHIVPIPGTTRVDHAEENFAALEVNLGAEGIAAVDELVNQQTVAGARYNAAAQASVDTEEIPA